MKWLSVFEVGMKNIEDFLENPIFTPGIPDVYIFVLGDFCTEDSETKKRFEKICFLDMLSIANAQQSKESCVEKMMNYCDADIDKEISLHIEKIKQENNLYYVERVSAEFYNDLDFTREEQTRKIRLRGHLVITPLIKDR